MMCFVYFRKPCEIRKGSEKTDLYEISDETKYQLGSTAGITIWAVRLESCCWFFIAQRPGVELEKVATSLQKNQWNPQSVPTPLNLLDCASFLLDLLDIPPYCLRFPNLSSPFSLDLFSLVHIPSPMPFFFASSWQLEFFRTCKWFDKRHRIEKHRIRIESRSIFSWSGKQRINKR